MPDSVILSPRRVLRRVLQSAICGALVAAPVSVYAADGGELTVEVSGVPGLMRQNVLNFLQIRELEGKQIESLGRLKYLHREATDQIQRALQPFGFYHPDIETDLEEVKGGWKATYKIDAGPPLIISKLDVQLSGEGASDQKFINAVRYSPMRERQRIYQPTYEDLKKDLQVIASERGYFDAKLLKNEIRVDLPTDTCEVTLHFETGPRYKLGSVSFDQDKRLLTDDLLQRFTEIEPGQPYDVADLQQLQGDLSNAEYFKQVEVDARPEAAGADHVIPVVVRLEPQKRRRYTYGIGYGTDTGVRVKAGINGRRVNSRGHHFTAETLVSEIGYGVAGEYIIPGEDPRSDAWGLRGSFENEHSAARNYEAFNIGGYFKYRDGLWVKTYALDYRVEKFELTDDAPTSSLLMPSVDWSRTFPAELEKRINTVNGTWLQMRLRGAEENLLSDVSFVQSLISAKWIHSFDNRTRVIARGAVGATWIDEFAELPTSIRFYTGGDRTVRGYDYDVIGPEDKNGDVVGGKNLTEASLEYEVPFMPKWSVAAFADIGDAFDDTPDYKTGVGLGVRWQSPIGPVRLDFAHALDQPPGSNLRVHLNIGPDL